MGEPNLPQRQALVATLKRALKAHGLGYRDVAETLGLSEASVKRLFSRESLTLERLDAICGLVGLEIADLVRMMDTETRRLTRLSEAQEQELVADPRLLVVAFLVLNGWRFEDILRHYAFTEHELVRHLAHLDRLRLIELLPGNRIRLRVSARFGWRRNGPIQRYFTAHLQQQFLGSGFDQPDERLEFLSGMLSRGSVTELDRRVEQLAALFDELNREDRHLPLDER